MIKPQKLSPGDKIATVSLSWGGPSVFPHRYQVGVQQLKDKFGLQVVEMPHTLKDADWLSRNPRARADDFMQAFFDSSIKGIFASIGGDDSIRLAIVERAQEHPPHHAEDGRVGADSEREREDRRGGEAGALRQRADGVAEVAEHERQKLECRS